jgi:hypothetical protein
MISRLRAAFVGALLTLLAAPNAALAQADVIRGRVTGPDSLPIEGVVVTATTISGNVSRNARTDRQGRYTITFANGEGDYMLSFAAIGFAARRFQLKRISDEDVLIGDARLQRVSAVLDAVEVVGERQRPNRNLNNQPDPSGTERVIANTEVPPNALGDLAAMAATLPGVQAATGEDGSNGYSVLGLGADQNNTTLNGMNFGGNNLPRDAAVSTSLATSLYDVSRGGFSGAQQSIRTRPGSNFQVRTLSLNFDSPAMQWTDPAARSLGQEYSNASLGGLLSGPLVFDKAFYSVSYQLGRRSNDFQTLSTTDDVGLKTAGVSATTKTSLLSAMSGFGIPQSVGPLREDRIGDNGMILGSIDLTSPSATSGRAINIAFNGNWSKQTPAGGSATEVPSFGGERTNWRYGVQARHSNFFGVGILTETSLGVNAFKNYGESYLDLPAGRVRATSTFSDGTSAVSMLSFGGNPGMNTEISSLGTAFQNQLSWFSKNNKHRLKLTSELRHENADQLLEINTFGTFTYNSLADLQANTPVSFSRSLAPRQRDVSQLVGAVSLGDSYRKTDRLQLTYGVRLDGAQYLKSPLLNLSLDTLYGLRNDQLPNRIYASPRVGFSWSYGTSTQIASFFGAQRGPRAVIRGGVGVFQGLPGTNTVGAALDNTGLPSAVQQVTCVGAATPIPDWTTYANDPTAIPETCIGGGTGNPFANVAPNVTAFNKDFVSPRSIRSNINWTGPTLNNRFSTNLDLTYSANLNQQSSRDVNFTGATQFTLDGEASRPVFVGQSHIVPATGAIASQAARISPRYSRVTEMLSDLRSESWQATLRLSPMRFSTGFSWSAWYTYSAIREQFRGFSSTVGNPFDVAWGKSSQSPHQIGYSLNYNAFDLIRISWFGQFRSGMRYTPMVGGDINGDGNANDRAFIFAPTVADTAIANGMQALLASGSKSAQSCLSSQIGKLAGRFSCQGPWISNASMSITFNPIKVRMPQRAALSFQLSNPLGAADMIVNGDNLKGWGQTPVPDAQLLYVRGFTPGSGTTPASYRYEVNRRFGATNPAFNQFRTPVTLTALLRFDVGPTRERQMLTQQLDRGRRTQGNKVPEQLLRAMFGNGGIPNPMAAILRDQDTLKLTSKQADSIATLNRGYVIALDQIWSPLVKDFALLPDRFEHDEVYHRYIVARKKTVDLLKATSPKIRKILTEEQYRRLPPFVAMHLDTRYLASIRAGTANLGASGFAGAMPAGIGDMIMVGGGGGQRIEIRQ